MRYPPSPKSNAPLEADAAVQGVDLGHRRHAAQRQQRQPLARQRVAVAALDLEHEEASRRAGLNLQLHPAAVGQRQRAQLLRLALAGGPEGDAGGSEAAPLHGELCQACKRQTHTSQGLTLRTLGHTPIGKQQQAQIGACMLPAVALSKTRRCIPTSETDGDGGEGGDGRGLVARRRQRPQLAGRIAHDAARRLAGRADVHGSDAAVVEQVHGGARGLTVGLGKGAEV